MTAGRVTEIAAAHQGYEGKRAQQSSYVNYERQAVSSTGARFFSGSHQSRFAVYQSTVSARPSRHPCAGSQPSSSRIFVASSR